MVIFLNSKNGMSEIISVLLLMFVVAVTFTSIYNWNDSFSSQFYNKNFVNNEKIDLELLDLSLENGFFVLYVKNPSLQYVVLDKISINSVDCDLPYSNVVTSLDKIYLNCSVSFSPIYDINVVSNSGIFNDFFSID